MFVECRSSFGVYSKNLEKWKINEAMKIPVIARRARNMVHTSRGWNMKRKEMNLSMVTATVSHPVQVMKTLFMTYLKHGMYSITVHRIMRAMVDMSYSTTL